jgi:PBP1b-binding outer membrane lipoprotein LpoB
MRNLFALMLLVAALVVTGCAEKKDATDTTDTTAPPVEGTDTDTTTPAETPAEPAAP